MSQLQPPFVPAGIAQLDVVTPDDDRLVVRVRSAAALGVPVCPWTVHSFWPTGASVAVAGDDFPDPAYSPVYAVVPNASEGEISARDARGYAATVHGPDPSAVGGTHLVSAWGSSEMAALFPDFNLPDHGPVWSIAADPEVLPDGPWRTTGADAVGGDDGDRALAELLGSSGAFVHPFDYLDSLPPDVLPTDPDPVWVDPVEMAQRAREALAPGVPTLVQAMSGDEPPDWTGTVLTDTPTPQGQAGLDLQSWIGVVGADPVTASRLGTYAVLPGAGLATTTTVTAVTAFVAPTFYRGAPPALRVAWGLAADQGEQDELLDRLTRQHPGLDDVRGRMPDTHQLVAVCVPAIVGRLPQPPAAPVLAGLSAGVAVSGHQGGPVALQRFDGRGTHRDRYLLVPATGEVLDPVGAVPPGQVQYEGVAQDVWGQWSRPGSSVPVDRPVPPTAPPTVSLELEPARVEDLPAGGPASPGTVMVRAFAPLPPTFGVEIDTMEAGVAGGSADTIPLAPDPAFAADQPAAEGRWWRGDVRVAPTHPGEERPVRVSVIGSAAGTDLTATPCTIRVVDPRPVVVELFSRVMLFAGAAGPDPTDGAAQVDLLVPAPSVPAGTTFRLYAADEAAIPGAPVPDLAAGRHARVDRLLDAARGADASRWVRLPDDAVTRTTGGELRVRATLPGRSETLRVLRLAAVSAGGVEALGSSSGAFVVAAPLDDVPGVATLSVTRDGARRLRARVTLTHPRPAGSTSPAPFALRGVPASTPVAAEVWWGPDGAAGGPHHVVPAGRLGLRPEPTEDGAPWHWSGEVSLGLADAAPPWLPLRLRARVAWPAEPAWVPGTTPVRGQVRRRWGDVDAQPGRWSAWSVAVSATAGEASLDATVSETGGGPQLDQPRVRLPELPPGSAPYRIEARTAWAEPVLTTSIGGTTDLALPRSVSEERPWLVTLTSPDGTCSEVHGPIVVPMDYIGGSIYDPTP